MGGLELSGHTADYRLQSYNWQYWLKVLNNELINHNLKILQMAQ